MKTNRTLSIIILLVISLGFTFFCSKDKSTEQNIETDKTASVAFLVSTHLTELSSITEYFDYAGSVRSQQEQVILPEVSGRIIKMYKEVGNLVKEGDLLFKLNDILYKSQYEQASAALKSAEISFNDAKKNKIRTENVYKKQGVSKTQYEQVVSAHTMAENALKQAKAGYTMAKFNYKSCEVKAPLFGTITSKNNKEGDYINPVMTGGRGVYTLENYQMVYIDVDIPLSEAEIIKNNMPADILLKDNIINAKVLSINKKTDPQSSSVSLQISANNPDGRLLPGRVVQVRIHYTRKNNVIVIPAEGLLDGNVVYIKEGDLARRRDVETGLINESHVEIISGIKEGERVIIKGNFGLFNDAPIKEKQ